MWGVFFSLSGRIHRGTFLLAIIIQLAFIFIVNWGISVIAGNAFKMHFINTLSQPGQITNISTVTESDVLAYSIAMLVLLALIGLLNNWVYFALYIKRYRDIGIHWIIAVFLCLTPYVIFTFFSHEIVSVILNLPQFIPVLNANYLPVFSPDVYTPLATLTVAFILFEFIFLVFVPFFWGPQADLYHAHLTAS